MLWFDGNVLHPLSRLCFKAESDQSTNVSLLCPAGEECRATECCGFLDVTMQVLQHRYDHSHTPVTVVNSFCWYLKLLLL